VALDSELGGQPAWWSSLASASLKFSSARGFSAPARRADEGPYRANDPKFLAGGAEGIVPGSGIAFGLNIPIYHGTLVNMADDSRFMVERVQTGVRMEKRLLKVLKAFAEFHDLTLGDLLEGIVLHAFEGKCPFNGESQARIKELKRFYGLDLEASSSHKLKERGRAQRSAKS